MEYTGPSFNSVILNIIFDWFGFDVRMIIESSTHSSGHRWKTDIGQTLVRDHARLLIWPNSVERQSLLGFKCLSGACIQLNTPGITVLTGKMYILLAFQVQA
jgi:hypothetical protein